MHRRRRSYSDYRYTGLLIAGGIIVAWALALTTALFVYDLAAHPVYAGVALFVALTLLYTGLFISTHDAIHGMVVPRHRRWNDRAGRLLALLYAGSTFARLRRGHIDHHADPMGAEDPDAPSSSPAFLPWYVDSLRYYFTPAQGVALVLMWTAWLLLGAPYWNTVLFFAAPQMLSSLQVFYFGVYLPHRPIATDEAVSRSHPVWNAWSLLSCYHIGYYGYHKEHHRLPGVPWWRLPLLRASAQ